MEMVFSNVQISGMGMGRTLREWEGLGIVKTIPARLQSKPTRIAAANLTAGRVHAAAYRRDRISK